jgi:hypothetical protein
MKYLSPERVLHTEVEKHFLKGCAYHYMHTELCLEWNRMICVNSEEQDSFHFCNTKSKRAEI